MEEEENVDATYTRAELVDPADTKHSAPLDTFAFLKRANFSDHVSYEEEEIDHHKSNEIPQESEEEVYHRESHKTPLESQDIEEEEQTGSHEIPQISEDISKYKFDLSMSNLVPPTDPMKVIIRRKTHSEHQERCSSYPISQTTLMDKIIGGPSAILPKGFSRNEQDTVEVLSKSVEKLLKSKDYDQNIFYCIANQLYRRGSHTTICPLCKVDKESRRLPNNTDTAHPDNHIFPKSLLQEYKKIHCATGELEFIYDHYTDQFKAAKSLTFPLFCHMCENSVSKEECYLRDLYLQIMGADDNQRLRITSKETEMLKHILATILFRGMLIGVNLFEEIHEKYFDKLMETFFELREFCLTYKTETDPTMNKQLLRRIHVFLLPNSHYNPNNIDPTYILDLQLRNPLFTSVIKQKGSNKAYLYTKFDCFHCVLPVDDSYGHFLKESSCFIQDDKDHYILPHGAEGIYLFPQLLFNYNLNQIEHLIQLSSSLKQPCRCLVHNLAGESWPRRNMHLTEDAELPIFNVKQFMDDNGKEQLREHAKKLSPIANKLGPQETIIKELVKRSKALEQKQMERSKHEREFKTAAQAKEKTFHQLVSENMKLKQENEHLKVTIEELKSVQELNQIHPLPDDIEVDGLAEPISDMSFQ